MDPRQELEELRRLQELESKLAAQDLGEVRKQKEKAMANAYAGEDVSTMGAIMRGVGGAKHALDSAAMGVKKLLPQSIQDAGDAIDRYFGAGGLNQDTLDQGEAFMKQGGGAATVGNVLGDVALTAAPALRAQQGIVAGARMLPQAAQWVGRSIPAAAGAGAVTGAVMDPNDRTGAALGGAAGGAIGEGAGKLLTKTLGGVVSGRVTPEAQALMDQGAYVPMWKGTDSPVLRNVAERARALPVVGSLIKGQERAGIESWNKVLAKEATPPMPVLDDAGKVLRWENKPVTDVGHKGLNELAQRFDDAYGALYNNRGVPVDFHFGSDVANLVESTKRYYPSVAADVEGVANKVTDNLLAPDKGLNGVVSYNAVKQSLDDVEKSIRSAWNAGNSEKAEALTSLRDSIEALRHRGLPPEVQSMAGDVNQAYAKFKTMERAASTLGAQKNGAVITPSQQLSSIKARDRTPGKSSFARGNAPGQKQALTAQEVYGNELPDIGPGTAEKLLPFLGFGLPMMGADLGATALLGTKTGQKFLMGQLPGQAGVRKYGQEYLVPALRTYGTAIGD